MVVLGRFQASLGTATCMRPVWGQPGAAPDSRLSASASV